MSRLRDRRSSSRAAPGRREPSLEGGWRARWRGRSTRLLRSTRLRQCESRCSPRRGHRPHRRQLDLCLRCGGDSIGRSHERRHEGTRAMFRGSTAPCFATSFPSREVQFRIASAVAAGSRSHCSVERWTAAMEEGDRAGSKRHSLRRSDPPAARVIHVTSVRRRAGSNISRSADVRAPIVPYVARNPRIERNHT